MYSRALLSALICAGAAFVSELAVAQIFMGASIGGTRADAVCEGNSRCDKTSSAFKLMAGHMATPEVGMEGMYFQLGKARFEATDPGQGTSVTEYKSRGFGVFGVAVAPFTESFSVIGKVGIVQAKTHRELSSPAPGTNGAAERSVDLAWGVGIGYVLTTELGVRIEWERMRLKIVSSKSDIDLVTLALLYRF